MASVDRVAKNGNNTAQNYSYAMAADVYDAVRSELARRFVLLVPRVEAVEFTEVDTKAGGKLKLCMWRGGFDFTDAETGEVLSVKAFGQGSDSGDKALYKAITGATKSVLVQMFLIPTGDDPENEKAEKPKLPAPAGLASVKAKMPSATQNGAPATHDRALAYPFGNDKGDPISAVDDKSIAFWIGKVQSELADASKAKWHERGRATLATLQAEQRYRAGGTAAPSGGQHSAPAEPEGPPPLTDEDAPH